MSIWDTGECHSSPSWACDIQPHFPSRDRSYDTVTAAVANRRCVCSVCTAQAYEGMWSICQSADSSSVTRQHSFAKPPSFPLISPLLFLSAAAVLERSDRLIVRVCKISLIGVLLCVPACAAMSDRWCAYVVMSQAAQRPFSLTPPEGFRWQHSSLNHPYPGSWSWSSAGSLSLLQAPIHPRRKGQNV